MTEQFTLPVVGTWSPTTQIHLVRRKGTWLVAWTPATINPALRAGDRLLVARDWPARAPILGAGGAPLVTQHGLITVGVIGSRIKDPKAVRRDLRAAGAPATPTGQALTQAKAHPTYFDPVFQISPARFAQLKRQSGPNNVYSVPETTFERSRARSAITPNGGVNGGPLDGPLIARLPLGPPLGTLIRLNYSLWRSPGSRRCAMTTTNTSA